MTIGFLEQVETLENISTFHDFAFTHTQQLDQFFQVFKIYVHPYHS